ncbi:MAG TPA: bifunctional glutamate N-acetyltransferase/amino-acid acetyltransferase ArgJ, partial [Savagea sp.]
IDSNLVGVASTGIIGEQMNMEPVLTGIDKLYIGTSSENAIQVSQAILTTDTVTKTTSYVLDIDGKEVTISGVAKGSGMIAPNMATMLAFITTDAAVTSEALQQALSSITDQTFNSITVDGDTSTNDTVLVMANGMAENDMLTDAHPDWDLFVEGVRAVSEDLAKMIAKDGEGATKLVEVNVNNGMCEETSRIIAKKVVGSPLVKTAMYGNDGNWGRIIAAIGYSGVPIDPNKISIKIGPFDVLSMGEPVPFEDAAVTHYLKKSEVVIDIDLGIGDALGTAWGCDLSYDYVQINASYRT